nr:putative protein TPRXL [Salvelinus alpinus]
MEDSDQYQPVSISRHSGNSADSAPSVARHRNSAQSCRLSDSRQTQQLTRSRARLIASQVKTQHTSSGRRLQRMTVKIDIRDFAFAQADSASVRPDSAPVRTRTLDATMPDSATVSVHRLSSVRPDSAPVRPDSAPVRPDSAPVRPDSATSQARLSTSQARPQQPVSARLSRSADSGRAVSVSSAVSWKRMEDARRKMSLPNTGSASETTRNAAQLSSAQPSNPSQPSPPTPHSPALQPLTAQPSKPSQPSPPTPHSPALQPLTAQPSNPSQHSPR